MLIAYTQGEWSSQFKAEETALGNFYVKRDEIRMVKFMNQEGAFNYYTSEELQAHVVELPYQVSWISQMCQVTEVKWKYEYEQQRKKYELS